MLSSNSRSESTETTILQEIYFTNLRFYDNVMGNPLHHYQTMRFNQQNIRLKLIGNQEALRYLLEHEHYNFTFWQDACNVTNNDVLRCLLYVNCNETPFQQILHNALQRKQLLKQIPVLVAKYFEDRTKKQIEFIQNAAYILDGLAVISTVFSPLRKKSKSILKLISFAAVIKLLSVVLTAIVVKQRKQILNDLLQVISEFEKLADEYPYEKDEAERYFLTTTLTTPVAISKPITSADFFSAVPTAITKQLFFNFFSAQEIVAIKRVSKTWNTLGSDKSYWHHKLQQHLHVKNFASYNPEIIYHRLEALQNSTWFGKHSLPFILESKEGFPPLFDSEAKDNVDFRSLYFTAAVYLNNNALAFWFIAKERKGHRVIPNSTTLQPWMINLIKYNKTTEIQDLLEIITEWHENDNQGTVSLSPLIFTEIIEYAIQSRKLHIAKYLLEHPLLTINNVNFLSSPMKITSTMVFNAIQKNKLEFAKDLLHQAAYLQRDVKFKVELINVAAASVNVEMINWLIQPERKSLQCDFNAIIDYYLAKDFRLIQLLPLNSFRRKILVRDYVLQQAIQTRDVGAFSSFKNLVVNTNDNQPKFMHEWIKGCLLVDAKFINETPNDKIFQYLRSCKVKYTLAALSTLLEKGDNETCSYLFSPNVFLLLDIDDQTYRGIQNVLLKYPQILSSLRNNKTVMNKVLSSLCALDTEETIQKLAHWSDLDLILKILNKKKYVVEFDFFSRVIQVNNFFLAKKLIQVPSVREALLLKVNQDSLEKLFKNKDIRFPNFFATPDFFHKVKKQIYEDIIQLVKDQEQDAKDQNFLTVRTP